VQRAGGWLLNQASSNKTSYHAKVAIHQSPLAATLKGAERTPAVGCNKLRMQKEFISKRCQYLKGYNTQNQTADFTLS
jgi:hypothetical protein